MNYLFFVQTIFEMDNPRIYTNYVTYFKKYIQGIRSVDRECKVTVVMGEAASFCGISFPDCEVVVVTQNEMLNNGAFDHRVLLQEYYRFCHERSEAPSMMDYHISLFRSRIKTKPDVIVTRDNAPYLEILYPEALVLYTEVGFISRKPFEKTMYFDYTGMNCGSYLSLYWSKIKKEVLEEYHRFPGIEEQIHSCKARIKKEFMAINPFSDIVKQYRKRFAKIYLLALQFSGFSNIDAELELKSQLDAVMYVLDRVPSDIGVIVTMHPDYKTINEYGIWYLKKKYPNCIFDTEFVSYASSSQFLLGLIDGVINLTSTIGLQTIFFDIPNLQIGKYFASYCSRVFGENTSFDALTDEEIKNNNLVLYWLLTHYVISPKYYDNSEWLYSYFRKMKLEKDKEGLFRYPLIDNPLKILSEFTESIDVTGLPERIEKENKERVYYTLFANASRQYFRGKCFSEVLVGKKILIYGKSSLAYVLEMEIKQNEELNRNYCGIIDQYDYKSYKYDGDETIVVTPVLEYENIKKAIETVTDAECISIDCLINE